MYYDTFKGMCREADMQAYLKTAFDRRKILDELNNPSSEFYFLYRKYALAGYMKLNDAPAQSDINDEKSLELERIYVAKSEQGTGLGAYLMSQAIRIATEKGKDYLWLGVWEKNEKAISFYNKHGFYKIGSHSFIMGDDIQHDYTMRKDLADIKGAISWAN